MGSGRTGILTFHRCINYGSYWQARCLTEGLRSRGHDAILLDHVSRRVNRAEWKSALQPLLPSPTPRAHRLRYLRKIIRFLLAFAKLPKTKPFRLEKPNTMEPVDTVLVGSDEVWNLRHPWYGGCSIFFGDGLPARRLVAHAASFGSHDVWSGLDDEWAEKLRRFDSISVRDDNSWWIIKHFLQREVDLVLDPCLQFPPAPDGEWRGIQGRFILVYGHGFSEAFKVEARRVANQKGLPLVSLGYSNDWTDLEWIDASPDDFLLAMARAEGVVTNFFHGCVFAILNGKPFVSETTPYRQIKVRALMEALGSDHRLLAANLNREAMAELMSTSVEARVIARLKELRSTSNAYLDRALA